MQSSFIRSKSLAKLEEPIVLSDYPELLQDLNYCFSGIECKDEIYSSHQLSSSTVKIETDQIVSSPETIQEVPQEVPQVVLSPKQHEDYNIPRREAVTSKVFAPLLNSSLPRPQTATSKLFAPRTEEMNKGFLMFSDEEPGLTSKFFWKVARSLADNDTTHLFTFWLCNIDWMVVFWSGAMSFGENWFLFDYY